MNKGGQKMKNFIALLLTAGMILSINTLTFASSDVKIKVNGTLLSDAQAILKNGSTLLPVRSVSTALGGEVVWDADTKTASIDKGGTIVAITIGQKEISINNKKQAISTPAQIVSGRTYVPLRALGEALECDITWVKETKTVEITQQDPSEYKAWYEADDKGNLYIKTNINSQKWDGYGIARRIILKDGSYSWDTQSGSDMVQYNVTSSHSHNHIGDIITQSEFYVFKGRGSNMRFWSFYETAGKLKDHQKAIAAMGDTFVCQINLDNKITIKELDESIAFTDFKIAYDKANQQETYTAVIANEIRKDGEYGLIYEGNHANHGLSYIDRGDNVLTFTREIHHFADPGTSGTFYISYVTHSMDDKGNITVYKAESNGLSYQFPLYY